MNFLYLIFYACQWLRFLDVETNPSPRSPIPAVCRILYSNVRDLAGNLNDLAWPWLRDASGLRDCCIRTR